jgi:A nuclease family of the HNH/ENDO VII superfamily with conserved AHH
MTEIGEAITIPEFVPPGIHDKDTCPWEQTGDTTAKKMDPPEVDEDTPGSIPKNMGKKLGDNLEKSPAGEKEPLDGKDFKKVTVMYKRAGAKLVYKEGGKQKKVQPFAPAEATDDPDEWEYDVQYAPHHLIPGNESLKNSTVVRYMGDDNVIEVYKENQPSKIKDNQSIGYDVNAAENGVWLPSPYALSMRKNEWPSEAAIEAIRQRAGKWTGPTGAVASEEFKMAFAVATMEQLNPPRQFHMRHAEYSNKVREILNAIGTRMWFLSIGACPFAKSTMVDGKWDAPAGLLDRLHLLSANLRRLVLGGVWRDPLFTDGLTAKYAKEKLGKATTAGTPIDRIV